MEATATTTQQTATTRAATGGSRRINSPRIKDLTAIAPVGWQHDF
jgi:hypothetical protein